jgi:hypothetical protein
METLSLALDVYAAANLYPDEGWTLARMTQEAAVRYAQEASNAAEIKTLLAFAHALGYLENDVYEALKGTF